MTVSNFPYPPYQKPNPKPVSWAVFEKKYLSRENSWKYEWVNGIIEKTKRTIYPYQHHILFNLHKLFTQLLIDEKVAGSFVSGLDIFFLHKIYRRPNISYFNLEQVALMAYGKTPVPEFVIEVVSNNDVLPNQNKKMKQYREAGIKVIWEIYPETKEVYVTKGLKSIICSGGKICSAAPVLPDFKIAAKDIFKKPPKPKSID